jgi:Ca-activated chloride channel homolog
MVFPIQSPPDPICVLQATAIRGRFEGLLGEIRIEQTFANQEDLNIEAVFTFPIPAGAELLNLEIQIAEEVFEGQVRLRQEAEETYEEAIHGGDSAILLQRVKPGLFKVNLGNLQPGQTARLRYRYALLSTWLDDWMRLLFPTTLAERYGKPSAAGLEPHQVPLIAEEAHHRFSLDLEFGGALREAVVDSPSHALRVTAEGDHQRVRLADDLADMDQDLVIRLQIPAPSRASTGLYAPDGDGWIVLASLQPTPPEFIDPGAHDYLLIADRSGSMKGDSIAQTREALLTILDRLNPTDRFNLICFGTEAYALFPDLQPVRPDTLALARKQIIWFDADLGGTEVGKALRLAYRQRQHQPLDILLVSDGQIWEDDAVFEEARRSGNRVFTVGVGAAVAEELTHGLAAATGAASALVHPNEAMADSIVRHFERTRDPRLEVSLTWPSTPAWQLPAEIDTVLPGDTLHLFAWLPERPQGPVTLQTRTPSGEHATHVLYLEPWPVAETGDTLPRLAAARRLVTLPKAEAAQLALDARLVTPETPLVMVVARTDGAPPETLPQRRVIAHQKPVQQVRANASDPGGRVVDMIPLFYRSTDEGFNGPSWMLIVEDDDEDDDGCEMADKAQPTDSRMTLIDDDGRETTDEARPTDSRMTSIDDNGEQNDLLDFLKPFNHRQRRRREALQRKHRLESKASILTAASLLRWLESSAARSMKRATSWFPDLDMLERMGLPPDLLTALRALVAEGKSEEAVLAALFETLWRHGATSACQPQTEAAVPVRCRHPISAELIARIEPLVLAWRALGVTGVD